MPVQAIERDHRHLWLAGPGRLELGTKCHDQQHWQTAAALDGEVEKFARSRVYPMGIFEDHDHRAPTCQAFELTDQRFERPVLFALRTEVR